MTGTSSPYLQEAVGRRLIVTRELIGKSQTEFAEMLDIGVTRLNNWEGGKRLIPPEFAIQVCIKCNVDLDWIYRGLLAGLQHHIAEKLEKYSDDAA